MPSHHLFHPGPTPDGSFTLSVFGLHQLSPPSSSSSSELAGNILDLFFRGNFDVVKKGFNKLLSVQESSICIAIGRFTLLRHRALIRDDKDNEP